MNDLNVGEFGQLEGFPQHDAYIRGIHFRKDAVEIQLSHRNGSISEITFNHLERMVINDLREGNIVDRFYIWSLADVPELVENKLNAMFTPMEMEGVLGSGFALLMECSYGAELYALIKYDGNLQHYLGQLDHGIREA